MLLDTMSMVKQELDQLVNFYVESERIVMMKLGETLLEILCYAPIGRGYPLDFKSNDVFAVHLAFETNDIEGEFQKLKRTGIIPVSAEPQTVPASNPDLAGTKVLYFLNPEGHPLELIQPRS